MSLYPNENKFKGCIDLSGKHLGKTFVEIVTVRLSSPCAMQAPNDDGVDKNLDNPLYKHQHSQAKELIGNDFQNPAPAAAADNAGPSSPSDDVNAAQTIGHLRYNTSFLAHGKEPAKSGRASVISKKVGIKAWVRLPGRNEAMQKPYHSSVHSCLDARQMGMAVLPQRF